jgi:hypothetical protein
MKITRNASGKPTIKLSQKEWRDFGKKAGWLDDNGELIAKADTEEIVREAQPAPAAPPRTKPAPTKKPGGKPGRRKRRDPNPKVDPRPKGREKTEEPIEEEMEISACNLPTIASELKKLKKKVANKLTFEDLQVNPYFTSISKNANYFKKVAQNYPDSYEQFWANLPPEYAVANSEFIRNHGGNLSRANFDHLVAKAREKNLPPVRDIRGVMMGIMQTLGQIKQLEAGHEEELVELAKDVIAEEWGVDRDDLNANFWKATRS